MKFTKVAPHWGAWIEIYILAQNSCPNIVAPHWGAWIEIIGPRRHWLWTVRRTPLGCVD